jgi:endonuclease/exonuclease/phosphatase family metal-dependent hydrolase
VYVASVRVLSWNLRKPAGRRLAAIVREISAFKPDVVLLQEVSVGQALELRRQLVDVAGLEGWWFSGRARTTTKAYGNAVAARGQVSGRHWVSTVSVKWPQLLAHGVVTINDFNFHAISIHAPNAAGNGWHKIAVIESMLEKVGGLRAPCIVAGDFNEPWRFERGGMPTSFRMRPKELHRKQYRDRFGSTRDRSEWQRIVAEALGSHDEQPLRNAWFERHQRADITTHEVRGQRRFFDHILVTSHFEVQRVGFEHSWRVRKKLSDHSAAWAQLRVP